MKPLFLKKREKKRQKMSSNVQKQKVGDDFLFSRVRHRFYDAVSRTACQRGSATSRRSVTNLAPRETDRGNISVIAKCRFHFDSKENHTRMNFFFSNP